jgi:hypothetical protein
MTSGLTSHPPNPQTNKMILKDKDQVELFLPLYKFWFVKPRSVNHILHDKKSASQGGAFFKQSKEWFRII